MLLPGFFNNYAKDPKSQSLKRLASIFFLLIFLFNTGGYYLVYWGIKQRAKENLLERLNASSYSKEESIVLTIPFSLPYQVSEGSYERVHGDFEIGQPTMQSDAHDPGQLLTVETSQDSDHRQSLE